MAVTDTLARRANPPEDPVSGVRTRYTDDEEQEGLLIMRRGDKGFRELVPQILQRRCFSHATAFALGVNVAGDVVLHWQPDHAAQNSRITRECGFAYITCMQRMASNTLLFVEADCCLRDNPATRDSLLRCAHGLLGASDDRRHIVLFLWPLPTDRSKIVIVTRQKGMTSAFVGAKRGQAATELRLNRSTGAAVVKLDGQLVLLPPPQDSVAFDLRCAIPVRRS